MTDFPLLNLAVEPMALESIAPHPKNPRKGSLAAIKESVKANGVYRPLIVQQSTGYILAGNHTYRALMDLGFTDVPVTFVDVDDETALRILLVDNRSADLGEYDEALLVELLSSLPEIAGTGYDDAALADLMDALLDPTEVRGDPDDAPPMPVDPVSRVGDVWLLGENRLICGDACDAATYEALLQGGVADALWTDPPYGVSYVGGTSDRLTIQNDGADEARAVVELFLATAWAHLRPGAPGYVCHAESQRAYLEQALADAGFLLRQALVWVKDRFVLGRSDYQNGHEPILSGEVPEKEFDHLAYGFRNGGEGRLGRGGPAWHGDNRQSTVFEVPKPQASKLHPTMKPVELIRPMLRNSVQRGGLVLDCFAGSGSTLIAAHMEGRRAALIELDPRFVDVICRRWETATGIVPVLEATGIPVSFQEGKDDDREEVAT